MRGRKKEEAYKEKSSFFFLFLLFFQLPLFWFQTAVCWRKEGREEGRKKERGRFDCKPIVYFCFKASTEPEKPRIMFCWFNNCKKDEKEKKRRKKMKKRKTKGVNRTKERNVMWTFAVFLTKLDANVDERESIVWLKKGKRVRRIENGSWEKKASRHIFQAPRFQLHVPPPLPSFLMK